MNKTPKHGKQVPGNPHPDTPYIIYEGEVEQLKTINDNLPTDELEFEALHIFNFVSDRRPLDALKSLLKYSIDEYKEAECSDNEREMRIHLEYTNRIDAIIKGNL